ncbi:MAG: hypothetical protein C4520_03975 [Candidatus Abyssobacteria bacterium SURF_5]|uniref:Uncharacterized protein n=1 Tax=Abyssobacteria bacterium (strain SURF_5) TaxID=2093360 RepID=A0A3A4NVK2_ABYX5|nr:MAG: hypothetical protein C4520_03975 [Candidatus Abyssubacteria bacterium SURF_5]
MIDILEIFKLEGEYMKKQKKKPPVVVGKDGGRLLGVIIPTGPNGEYKTVHMFIEALTSSIDGLDAKLISPSCVNLKELQYQIDRFKHELDCIAKETEKKLQELQKPYKQR